MTSMATGGAAQEIDFVTLGMFIIGMLFALLPCCPSAVDCCWLGLCHVSSAVPRRAVAV